MFREDHSPRLGDRRLFPDLSPRVYLNHAGISPPSIPVREAVLGLLNDYASHGAAAYPRWAEQRRRLKGLMAQLLGARPEDIAFAPNTSMGLTNIALCFPWNKGDRALCFQGEFPANITPWQRAAEAFELRVDLLPIAPFHRSSEEGLASVERELQKGARLLAVSAVQFQTGLRMPIAELAALCHRYGAEIMVDAVQAVGIVPLDVTALDVDYLAAGAHKWMMGLEGAGLLYVRRDRAPALRPLLAGWLSHEEPFRFLFEGSGHLRYDRPIRRSVDFFEGGNVNGMGFAALEASLGLIAALGVDAIFQHVNGYLDRLEEGLVERGFTSLRLSETKRRSGILSVLPPKASGLDTVAWQAALVEAGIACALPDGHLRFAPHWPNDPAEVGVVLSAVDGVLRR